MIVLIMYPTEAAVALQAPDVVFLQPELLQHRLPIILQAALLVAPATQERLTTIAITEIRELQEAVAHLLHAREETALLQSQYRA